MTPEQFVELVEVLNRIQIDLFLIVMTLSAITGILLVRRQK
jgi:hypothetical protein